MKKIFTILICSLFLCLFSCSVNQNKELIGTWEHNRLLKTELTDNTNVIGYMYTNQNHSYTLSEDGSYTKKIVQNFKELEWLQINSEITNISEKLQEELKVLNQEYVILGSYMSNKNQILFSPKYLLTADGEQVDIETIKDFLPQLAESEQKFYTISDSKLIFTNAFEEEEIFTLIQN